MAQMSSAAAAQQRQMPKDALVIAEMLKEMNITEYEPRVINQFLEFTYRYVATVLEDAKVYSMHAKKKVIDLDDVALAAQMQQDKSFTNPPTRDTLLEVARLRNVDPLPLVKPHCGIRLPADRYCLNSCNFRLKSAVPKKFGHSTLSTSNFGVQQGAIKLAPKAPQLQMMKRAPGQSTNMTTVPRTQAISTPRPVIKFTPAGGLQPQKMTPSTSKNSIQVATPGHVEVVMDTDNDNQTGVKRKREHHEFDM